MPDDIDLRYNLMDLIKLINEHTKNDIIQKYNQVILSKTSMLPPARRISSKTEESSLVRLFSLRSINIPSNFPVSGQFQKGIFIAQLPMTT